MGLLRILSPLVLVTVVSAFSDPFDEVFDLTFVFADGRVFDERSNVPSAGVTRTVSGFVPAAACGNAEGNIKTEVGVNRMDMITSPSTDCELDVFLGYDFSVPENFTSGDNNALAFSFSPFYNLALPPTFSPAEEFTWVACTDTCADAYPGGYPYGTVVSHTLPANCGRHSRSVLFAALDDKMGYWALSPLTVADFGSISCFFGEGSTVIGTTFGFSLLESTIVTTPSSLTGDPHLVGFHGERTELMAKQPTYYSVFCDSNTMMNIRTEPSAAGAVYMMAVNLKIQDEILEIDVNTFKNLRQLKAQAPSFLVIAEDVLKIQTGVLTIEISRTTESEVDFLDVSFSASEAAPAGGLIGRTLEKALTPNQFSAVEQYEVNADSHTGAHFCSM